MEQILIARTSLIVIILMFPLLGTLILGRSSARADRTITLVLFAVLNLGLTFGMFLAASWRGVSPSSEWIYLTGPAIFFAAYLGLALVQFLLLRLAVVHGSRTWFACFAFPIVALFFTRYLLLWWDPFAQFVAQFSGVGSAGLFLGISYLAFRAIRLAVEIRNGVVPMPTLPEFFAFVFFCPTMSIGPITTYSVFRRSLYNPNFSVTPPERALLRICKGLAKYLFLASLLSELGYSGLLLDGHRHGAIDLTIAVFAYYLYLYCNFSGFCDIAIGAAGLAGIQVDENFNNPLAARNIQEFWSRWHMSLSFFMRDLVFQPMTKWFMRRLGAKRTNEAMIFPTLAVFLLIGVWHGPQANYLLFGLAHGLAVIFIVYLSSFMRKHMGKARYLSYMENPFARAVAITLTFSYVAATHFLFANTLTDMKNIFMSLG